MDKEQASKLLLQLARQTDVTGLREALKTLKHLFVQDTLDKALDIASQELETETTHIEERFEICSELLTAGARMIEQEQSFFGLIISKYSPLVHVCCYHGNSVLLKQAFDTLNSADKVGVLASYERICISDGSECLNAPLSFAVQADKLNCVEIILNVFKEEINSMIFEIHCATLGGCIIEAAELGRLPILKQLAELYDQAAPPGFKKVINSLEEAAVISIKNSQHECAEFLLEFCPNTSQFIQHFETETEWELFLCHAINHAKPSVKYLPVEISHLNRWVLRWKCLECLLQDRFVSHYDLDNYDHCGPILEPIIDHGHLDILEKLLKVDIAINKRHHEWLPLAQAIIIYGRLNSKENTSWKIVRLLVSYGCDVNMRVTNERPDSSPAAVARRLPSPEVLEMLMLAGADKSVVPFTRLEYSRENKGETRQFCEGRYTEVGDAKELLIQNILHISHTTIPTLKHLSRLCVRDMCRSKSKTPIKFHKLNGILPPLLVNYLMFPEIDDIEKKYGI